MGASATASLAAGYFATPADLARTYVSGARAVGPVSLDGSTRVTTVPESIIRIRLKPGEHRLAVEWDGRSAEQVISGAAGDVRFVELVGRFWSWGGEFHWEEGSAQASRPRAISSKLIADLDMRS